MCRVSRYFVGVLVGLVLCFAFQYSAFSSLIYGFSNGMEILAEMELTQLPAVADDIVRFQFTPAGDVIFGLGILPIEWLGLDIGGTGGTIAIEDSGQGLQGLLWQDVTITFLLTENPETAIRTEFKSGMGWLLAFDGDEGSIVDEWGGVDVWVPLPSDVNTVPEPGTLVLVIIGLGWILGLGYRQHRQKNQPCK